MEITGSQARPQIQPELSIVVPVFNGASTLRACLDAILHAPGPSREIIVVDDGSQDNSREIAVSLGVHVIRNRFSRGSAATRNIGAEQACSPILVFIDSDCVIHSDALERIAHFFVPNNEYAAIFGAYDTDPSASNFISQYRNLLHHFTHQDGRRDAETFWTGLGAVRRAAFQQIGGFTNMLMEDVLFGLELTDSGFRIALDRQLLCTHLKRWTLVTMIRTDIFLRALPWSTIVLSRGRFTNDLSTNTVNKIGVVSSMFVIFMTLLSILAPAFIYLALLSLAANLISNTYILRRFVSQRGLIFGIRAIPIHFVHQLCAGLGFALALLQFGMIKFTSAIKIYHLELRRLFTGTRGSH